MYNEQTPETNAPEPVYHNGGVTKELFTEWLRKYPNMHRVTVPMSDEADNNEYAVCYLRHPSYADFEALGSSQNLWSNCKQLFYNLWLGGCDEIKTNDEMLKAVAPHMVRIQEIWEADFKKKLTISDFR